MAKYFGCVLVQRVVFPTFLVACEYQVNDWITRRNFDWDPDHLTRIRRRSLTSGLIGL